MTRQPAFTEGDIYERMLAALMGQQLAPGTRLAEEKLAKAFGVSRTLVRPALVRLANEQLVTLTPHRGATVAKPSEREAREVFEVRCMIEPRLMERCIANATTADLDVLARCIAEEESARLSGDMRSAIRLAGDFHLHIAIGAQHPTLERILRALISRTSLVLMTYGPQRGQPIPGSASCACQEHRTLLNAIRLRDASQAVRLMQQHLLSLEASLKFAGPDAAVPDLASVFGLAPQSGDLLAQSA